MNATMLANTLRERADQVQAQEPRRDLDFDNAELLRVLARVVEGKPLHKALGAPGDWGYNHPIAKAMLACANCGKPHRDCQCGDKKPDYSLNGVQLIAAERTRQIEDQAKGVQS